MVERCYYYLHITISARAKTMDTAPDQIPGYGSDYKHLL